MESPKMTIQGSRNRGSLDSDSSKDEKNDRTNGISGEGLNVCWNKFLPFRSLKVLVVESDDSTRHVVSALLKKCGYEVIAVANGLQAWKVLEDGNNHVDMVLTEVVLPFLTGLGLLRKIMSHETRKNLPVIMMSPSDSLGVVFKCLSKGATDFLVKPIRKNELRTLWQHVWRNRHSSSGGSVGESDAVTRSNAPVKSSRIGKSGSSSNNRDDNNGSHGLNSSRSHGLSDRNGSDGDEGSGIQAPKDNRKAKLDPPPISSSSGHLTDPPMHKWDLNHSAGELEGHIIGDRAISPSGRKVPEAKASSCKKTLQEYTSKELYELNEQALEGEVTNVEAHVAAASTRNIHPREKVADVGERNGLRNVNHLNVSDACLSEAGKGNGGKAARQRNVLGHSSHSAFSRYGSALKGNKVQSRNEGSWSPLEGGSEAATEEERLPKHQGSSSGTSTVHNSQDNSQTNDKGVVNDAVIEPPQGGKDKQAMNLNTKSPHPTLALPELNQHIQLQHHYHPYHHHHYQTQNMQQLKGLNHGDTAMNDVPIIPSVLLAPLTGNVMHNLNTSLLGHHHVEGSSKNSCSAASNTFGVNPMEDTGIVYGFMNGIAANGQLQRLAAIHKFRQRRKYRCFGKKVPCESRKILADQRPRMKGQFVRRADISNNTGLRFC